MAWARADLTTRNVLPLVDARAQIPYPTLVCWLASGEVRILDDQVLGMLRGQIGSIVLGTIFLFIGLASCAMAAIRGRSQLRILV